MRGKHPGKIEEKEGKNPIKMEQKRSCASSRPQERFRSRSKVIDREGKKKLMKIFISEEF